VVGSDQGVEEGHCRGFIVGRLNASARQNETASVLSLSFFFGLYSLFCVCLFVFFSLSSPFFLFRLYRLVPVSISCMYVQSSSSAQGGL
jgi:hypothetical protein